MYYEERWIGGKFCWRTSPDGAWTAYTANELAHRYQAELQRAHDLQRALDAEREKVKALENVIRNVEIGRVEDAEVSAHITSLYEQLATLQAQLRQVREALVKCRRELWHCNHQLKGKGAHEGHSVTEALSDADTALAATLAVQDAPQPAPNERVEYARLELAALFSTPGAPTLEQAKLVCENKNPADAQCILNAYEALREAAQDAGKEDTNGL